MTNWYQFLEYNNYVILEVHVMQSYWKWVQIWKWGSLLFYSTKQSLMLQYSSKWWVFV